MLAMAPLTGGPAESKASPVDMDNATDSPSSTSDDAGDEDDFYGNQDDAQSFIQPAISPIATRLTSPRTPAAEKAAAMDRLPGGYFRELGGRDGPGQIPPSSQHIAPTAAPPRRLTKPQEPGSVTTLGSIPSSTNLPANVAAGDLKSPKPAMAEALGSQQTRHRRSYSVGENALRRLSKALPSINLPTNFLPNISTPSFLSLGSSQKDDTTSPQFPQAPQTSGAQPPGPPAQQNRGPGTDTRAATPGQTVPRPGHRGPPSVASTRSLALRRSTSEDSVLYHSLARVSSFGDDDRFTHVREQVNSRFKAIKDSWDGPSFKLPSKFVQARNNYRNLTLFCRYSTRTAKERTTVA